MAISFFPTMGGAIALGVLGGYQRDEGTGAGRNIASEVWINAGRTIGTLAIPGMA